jgi:hypothetical protein
MKNTIKVLSVISLMLVIWFSMASCSSGGGGGSPKPSYTIEDTNGRLTITGLGSYNGKYVQAMNDSKRLGACASLTNRGENVTSRGGVVEGGEVTLKVWVNADNKAGKYQGNDSAVTFEVYISSDELGNTPDATGTVTVTFASGIGSGAFTPSP